MSKKRSLLAPLAAGQQIPGAWRGQPAWFTVDAVDGPGRYTLRNPDGTLSQIRDSE